MEGFDILYLIKTPLFMGNAEQIPAEARNCDVNEEDQDTMTEKNLLILRSLAMLNDVENLKAFIQSLMETPQKNNIQGFTILLTYLMQNKIDPKFIENSLPMLESNPDQVKQNKTLMVLLTYYLFAEGDFNRLLLLLNKTRNPEFLAVKIMAQLRMNRADLAEGTMRILKGVDEDNCLTILSQTWINLYKSGMPSNLDEIISQLNQMSERVNGYSLKTYNLLGCALMLKNDVERASKIFENAINQLQLDSEEGQAKLEKPNADLSCLIYNYAKCVAILEGQGSGLEFFMNQPKTKQLFGYLAKIDQGTGREFFEERQKAEALFDQALSSM